MIINESSNNHTLKLEAVTQRWSTKQVLLKVLPISQENISARRSFLTEIYVEKVLN